MQIIDFLPSSARHPSASRRCLLPSKMCVIPLLPPHILQTYFTPSTSIENGFSKFGIGGAGGSGGACLLDVLPSGVTPPHLHKGRAHNARQRREWRVANGPKVVPLSPCGLTPRHSSVRNPPACGGSSTCQESTGQQQGQGVGYRVIGTNHHAANNYNKPISWTT